MSKDKDLEKLTEKRKKELLRGAVSQSLSRRDSAKKPNKRVDK